MKLIFKNFPLLGMSVQQQRSTRIDQIMKLFPEQNPHMSHPSQQHQQQQLLLQHQLSSNQQPSSNILALSGSQSSINQSCNFPLAMDCDPPVLTSNVRYGGHVHRGRFPATSLMQQQNVGHKANYLNNYAPTSLPIELGQIGGGNSSGNSSLTSGYPLNLSGNGGSVGNSLVGYPSFPMTEPTSMVTNSKITTRSNVSSSNDRDESPMMCVQQSPVVIH